MINLIRVCAVDDNDEDSSRLSSFLKNYKKDNPSFDYSLESFDNTNKFIENYTNRFDIIFMDIDFNHKADGFRAIETIRKFDNNVTVMFVTNMVNFAVRGYEVSAFDFIVKPLVYDVFKMKMERLLKALYTKGHSTLNVSSSEGEIKVDTKRLLYVEVEKHKITYHTVDGNIETYDSMKNVEQNLNDPTFVKCNNCYLVNLRFVDSIQGEYVLVGKNKLLMSKPRRSLFKKALAKYLCTGSN